MYHILFTYSLSNRNMRVKRKKSEKVVLSHAFSPNTCKRLDSIKDKVARMSGNRQPNSITRFRKFHLIFLDNFCCAPVGDVDGFHHASVSRTEHKDKTRPAPPASSPSESSGVRLGILGSRLP